MTTPGDPLTSLGQALNRYGAMREAMTTAAQEITEEDEQQPSPPTDTKQDGTNGTFPTRS